MKNIFFIFLFTVITVQAQDLEQLRTTYPVCSENETATNALHEKLAGLTAKAKPTKKAYKGAVLTLKGKFAKGIKNKKEFFQQGSKLLEAAIAAEPNNIEIRCLRLGVQENSPKILKYKQHITEDKQFILENYNSVTNTSLQLFIKGYVTTSKVFTDTEKQLF